MKKCTLVCILYCFVAFSLLGSGRSEKLFVEKAIAAVFSTGPNDAAVQPKTEIVFKDSIKDKPKPVELNERFSYTYGYMNYLALKQMGFENIDSEFLAKGALDAQEGSGFFTQEEMNRILYEVQNKMLEVAQNEQEAIASENLEQAEAFLSLNKEQKGVKVTASGLQYKVITEGQGPKPTENQMVELDYHMTLLNKKVVDSSYDRGSSSRFQLKAIGVPGFIEGVKLMSQGSKYQFWIHPKLGYGKEGSQNIGPNTLLVVEVELKAVLAP